MTLTPSEPPVTDPEHFPEPDPAGVEEDMPGVDPDWPQTVRSSPADQPPPA